MIATFLLLLFMTYYCFKLQLWDTAAGERFRYGFVRLYYHNTDAVIFVYDITNKSSFENLQKWFDEYQMNISTNRNIPRVLIGNKKDLSSRREVRKEDARELAENAGVSFWETSAKSDSEMRVIEAIYQKLAEALKLREEVHNEDPTIIPVNNRGGDNLRVRVLSKFNRKDSNKCCVSG